MAIPKDEWERMLVEIRELTARRDAELESREQLEAEGHKELGELKATLQSIVGGLVSLDNYFLAELRQCETLIQDMIQVYTEKINHA